MQRCGPSTDPQATIVALGKPRVPVLIIYERQDTIVLPLAAEMTADTIPAAQLSWHDGRGHSSFQEDGPRFNGELAGFVISVAGR